MYAPDPENYTLGKGVVYFDKKNLTTGLYSGERDLGNSPEFSFNIALEKLDHFSSRSGIKAKDKTITSQVTPGVTFTLDELSKENFALLTLGEVSSVQQSAGAASAEAVTAHLGVRSVLANRDIGLTTLAHGTVTGGPFTVGETVTGGTSAAAGIVCYVNTSSVQVAVSSGTFQTGETITGGTSGATADLSADPEFVSGVVLVQDDTDTTTYTAGTDYQIDSTLKDETIGRILFLSGGSITEGDAVHVTYQYRQYSYSEVAALANNQLEGRLRFVSDNPTGTQYELEAWRVSLSPNGDTALIGDDWSTLGFTGEILKDASGHASQPYFVIRMFDNS